VAEKPSPRMEMYLKTILRTEDADGAARVSAIAETLGLRMPSVSEAIRSLKAAKLVLHNSYGSVRLSSRGRRAARAVDRRYTTLRRFLVEVLRVDEKTADRDACAIEHVVSSDTLRRLAAFLEHAAGEGKETK